MSDHTPTPLDDFLAAAVREAEAALKSDPDPRPGIERRILNGTLRPDWTTHAEVFQWEARQRERRAKIEALARFESLVVEGQVVG